MAMTEAQMLSFVHKMTHLGLSSLPKQPQYFPTGGLVLNGPSAAGPASNTQAGGIGGLVGQALGTNSSFQGSGAPIQAGTNAPQLNAAYDQTQTGLNNVNNLTTQLAPGITQGAQTQANLTGQLTQRAAGLGPNPAQAALNQATGKNISQAAALAAGVRGAGTNAGLIASNAAQQGAASQQEAIGQSATLQAQQEIAAQKELQDLAAQQIGQNTAGIQLENQAAQNEQNILQGANTGFNNASVNMQSNLNNVNAGIANANLNANQNVLGGIGAAVNSIGKAIPVIGGLFAKGGQVPEHFAKMVEHYHGPHFARGGMAWQDSTPAQIALNNPGAFSPVPYKGPSLASNFPAQNLNPDAAPGTNPTGVAGTYGGGGAQMIDNLNSIGGVPQGPFTAADFHMPDPTGRSLEGKNFHILPGMAQGGNVGKKLEGGGKVPGKAKIPHDDIRNDEVSAKLTPGEVVMDIDTLNDKGKLGQMARFVAANIERKRAGRKL